MMTQSHPTPEALSDFVQGRLEEVELEQVSAHLDACSACQRTLDQLSRANDTLIGKVREAGAAIESQPGEASAKGSVAPIRPKPPVAPREPAATPGLVIKPIAWETVQQILTDLELVSTEDLATLRQQLLAASSKELGSDALRELTDQGKLTRYQAQAIFQGKAHLLSYGEYTVLDRLGAGGMGQVFKAVHRRMRRIVALKVLSSSALKNPEAVRRFEREATAAAKLSHPAIVSAYDLNSRGKTSFLVMEYIEGRDLSKIVDSKGPLPVDTAIDYILQAAEALAFAHSHGIIHRDIKPANLLIDRDGRLKVLDLGLAKFEGAGGESSQTQLTVTAQVMGTVDYMAPEQALNTKKAEARSDIYSLGCTLYRLLTNQSVYDGETITERFLNHREAPIPSLRALRPDVPESLDELFRYMVGKKPEDRPATMDEVVKALQHITVSPQSPITAILPLRQLVSSNDTIQGNRESEPANHAATVICSPPPLATPPVFAASRLNASRRSAKPPRKRGWLIAVGGAGGLLLLFGIWVIVRDSAGNKLAEIKVPKGGSVTVVTPPPKSDPVVPAPAPTTPTPPVVAPSSPTSTPQVTSPPSPPVRPLSQSPSNTTPSSSTAVNSPSNTSPSTSPPMPDLPTVAIAPPQIPPTPTLPVFEVDADGFAKVINGRDLKGWVATGETESAWSVADNMLIGAATKRKSWLMTDREYEDFELRLEYRMDKGAKCGVCFGASLNDDFSGKEFYEIPLIDEGKPEFALLPERSKTGSIYGKLTRSSVPNAPAEEWNRLYVKFQRGRVTIAINDQEVLDDNLAASKGRIGFQLYPRIAVSYRNVRIKGKWLAPVNVVKKLPSTPQTKTGTTPTNTLGKSDATIGEWVNLLDWTTGYNWSRRGIDWNASLESPVTPRSLILKNRRFCRYPLPVVIDGDYDMEVEFTRQAGREAVCIFFPVGINNMHLEAGGWSGTVGGLNWIDGIGFADGNPTTIRPWPISNNVRHTIAIRVRRIADQASINVDWDGKRDLISWKGHYASLTPRFSDPWNTTTVNRPWLASWENQTVFHTLRVRMLSGEIRRDYMSESDRQRDRDQGFLRLTEQPANSPSVEYGAFAINQLPFARGNIIAEHLWPLVSAKPTVCKNYYSAHAPSRLKIPIPRDATHFSVVGFNQSSRCAAYLAYIDGSLIKKSGVCGFARLDFSIPPEASLLELVVDMAGDPDFDFTYWCNPQFSDATMSTLPFTVATNDVGHGQFAHNDPIAPGSAPPLELDSVVPCNEFIHAHAKSSVSYAIPPGMRRFTAVGYCVRSSSVVFSVWADATKVFESPSTGLATIDVTLPESAKTIELRIDPAGNNSWDQSMWCYPRLHRE